MKDLAKSSIKGLLLALALTLISGIGAVTASAGTLTADLDGDGKKEQIVWAEDDPDTITVNSTEVLKAADVSSADFYPDYFEVSVIDTCKKDKYKEICVVSYLEGLHDYYLFRYDNGKITKYAVIVDADEILTVKTKNRIKVRTYVFVQGIGNIRVDEVYKVKNGKATLKTKTFKPNGKNATKTFKSQKEMIIFKSNDWTKVAGTVKPGEKFTLVKFTRNSNGQFTNLYIKTASGKKGWINTSDYGFAGFIIENPPLWD